MLDFNFGDIVKIRFADGENKEFTKLGRIVDFDFSIRSMKRIWIAEIEHGSSYKIYSEDDVEKIRGILQKEDIC